MIKDEDQKMNNNSSLEAQHLYQGQNQIDQRLASVKSIKYYMKLDEHSGAKGKKNLIIPKYTVHHA